MQERVYSERIAGVNDLITDFRPDLVEFFLRARGNILRSTDKLLPLGAAIDGMIAVGGLPGFSFFVTQGGPVVWRFALLMDHFEREVAIQLREGTASAEQESEAVDIYVAALEQYLASMRDGTILKLYEDRIRGLAVRKGYNEPTLQKILSKLLHDWVSVCSVLERSGIDDSDCHVIVRDTKIPVSRSTFGLVLWALLSNELTGADASCHALLQCKLTVPEQSQNDTEPRRVLEELGKQAELRALQSAEPFSQLRQICDSL